MDSNISWEVIDKYFKENPYFLTRHNLDSFNHFMTHKISDIFRSVGGIKITKEKNQLNQYRYNATIYIGTKSFDKIYIDKPVINDHLSQSEGLQYRNLYPSEARLKNLDYSSNI